MKMASDTNGLKAPWDSGTPDGGSETFREVDNTLPDYIMQPVHNSCRKKYLFFG
jgi:hypothetical protein